MPACVIQVLGDRAADAAARSGDRGNWCWLAIGVGATHNSTVASATTTVKLQRRALAALSELAIHYPDTRTPLRHSNGFELLVATILSAQTTDEQVNRVSAPLFRRYPDVASLAAADTEEVERLIRSIGLFRNKARNIVACAAELLAQFDGAIPGDIDSLTSLPGVGRKTANVVAAHYLGLPGVIVDTHFGRVVRRLGLTEHRNPARVEDDVRAIVPPVAQSQFSAVVNRHGRLVCRARDPRCDDCPLASLCPSACLLGHHDGRLPA